ncbi:MAG: PEGA domain-containing protein [Planctomycetota bacterium]
MRTKIFVTVQSLQSVRYVGSDGSHGQRLFAAREPNRIEWLQNFLSLIFICVSGLGLLALSGCTSRGMTVTSDPPGAEVSINRRVVGRTPIRVGFTHYGTYRIELRERNYVTLIREEAVKPPIYGYDPAAFVADNVIPARLNDEVCFHYILKPLEEKTDRAALMERSELARIGTATHPRTGEQTSVELGCKSSKIASEGEAAENKIIPPVVVTQADTELPQTSGVQKPEGLRLAEQYGITATPSSDKRAEAASSNDNKKSVVSTPLRIPKDEELIYDEPVAPSDDQKRKNAADNKTSVQN